MIEDKLNKEIGNRIRLARQEMGLTQTELGDYLGLTKNAVSKIEKGFNALTVKNLFELPGVLQRPIGFFLGLESDLSPDEERLIEIYRAIPEGMPREYAFMFLKDWLKQAKSWSKKRNELKKSNSES